MFKISYNTEAFLEKNISQALDLIKNNRNISDVDALNDILEIISNWIDDNGFAPGGIYNEKGKQAQAAYDDLFYNN